MDTLQGSNSAILIFSSFQMELNSYRNRICSLESKFFKSWLCWKEYFIQRSKLEVTKFITLWKNEEQHEEESNYRT